MIDLNGDKHEVHAHKYLSRCPYGSLNVVDADAEVEAKAAENELIEEYNGEYLP